MAATAAFLGPAAIQGGFGLFQGLYQGQVADNNAKLATWNAVASMQKATMDAQDVDMETAGKIGEIVASQGASGISMSSPSSIQTRASAARLGRIDTLRTVYKGQLEANSFMNEAAQYKSQGMFSRIGGATSLLGSFAEGFANMYKQRSLVGGAQGYGY